MPSVMLRDGDFGAGIEIVVNETEFILPDPARPGLREAIPFSAIADMEAIADDRSGQYREALRLGLKGFRAAGPVGLAAGLLAVSKPKSTVFRVRTGDGRGFVAVADAATYAQVHGYFYAARNQPARAADTAEERAADAIVSRYMAQRTESAFRNIRQDSAATPMRAATGRAQEAGAPVFGRRSRS